MCVKLEVGGKSVKSPITAYFGAWKKTSMQAFAFSIFSLKAITNAPTVLSKPLMAFTSVSIKSHQGVSSFVGRHSSLPQGEVDVSTFDFASKQGWNDFYQQRDQEQPPSSSSANVSSSTRTLDSNNPRNNSDPFFEFEWHSSIDHSSILSSIGKGSNVLFVGTGNSNLPRTLHDAHEGDTKITCVDYSQPCIDMMQDMHGASAPTMHFLCGDARDLVGLVGGPSSTPYDVIVDKGLMDAMVCGEGWDWDLERYFKGVKTLLQDKTGNIILISFKLTNAMKSYLEDIGERYGIIWNLDIEEKSNERVSFSIGSC